MKPRGAGVMGVFLALAVVASFTFALAAPTGAQSGNGQYAGVYIDRTPEEVGVGDTFTANVLVTYDLGPGGGLTFPPVTDAEAHIDFDPTKLDVLGIAPGPMLENVIQSEFDNVAGTIDYRAGVIKAAPGVGATPEFVLCSLQIRAKGLTPGTPLQFVFLGPYRITDVRYFGPSVLDRSRVYNGNVIVSRQGAPSVPSVSQWGAIGMGTVMACALVWRLRRRTASL